MSFTKDTSNLPPLQGMHFSGDPCKMGKRLSDFGIGGQRGLAASEDESWIPAFSDSKPSSPPCGLWESLYPCAQTPRVWIQRGGRERGLTCFPYIALCLELSFGTNHSSWIQLK